jgi:cytochrome P450
VFTPRKVAALEPKIRQLCADALDPHVGTDGFDLVRELGATMPMRVIGMLLGVPEDDQQAIRDRVDRNLRTEAGQPMQVSEGFASGEQFAAYVDWRAEHPSDDIMTDLLNAEFEDETGTVRRLHREELLTYITVVSGAGNETTTRLIGWAGKTLAEHPEQRRRLVEDPSLIPAAIEELLRFEPPPPYVGRYVVAKDVVLHGQTVPEGSALLCLLGAANRDDRKHPDGDSFDIGRTSGGHLAFGFGPHFCMGASLARLELRVMFTELLRRLPDLHLAGDPLPRRSSNFISGPEAMPVAFTPVPV